MFREILGNEETKKILENSIKTQKISHSYMFIGQSGIGKFMMAKELAKAVSCQGEQKPCDNCEACVKFDGENNKITYEHTKTPVDVVTDDTVIYTIRVYNEGEIDGYASEITDDIPEYLEYLPEDSTNVEYMWKMYDENGAETEKVEEAVKVKTQYLSKENREDN